MDITWFLFDLGNTVIKLAYERVMDRICNSSSTTRDELLEHFDAPRSYRDMERGTATFHDFYETMRERAGYRGSAQEFHALWSDFFDGPIPGIEQVLDEVRKRYRVAFLSNSNEVHAELIPREFAALFQKDDRFIFSYRFQCAKPDPELYRRALEVVGALPHQVVFIDDLLENVQAARALGMHAIQFEDSAQLMQALRADGLLPDPRPAVGSTPTAG